MQLAGVFGGLFEHQFGMRSALEKLAGPRKVLFGSDGPWLHPGIEFHKIKMLLLRPEEERLITGQNAARLLDLGGVEVRPAATQPHLAMAE